VSQMSRHRVLRHAADQIISSQLANIAVAIKLNFSESAKKMGFNLFLVGYESFPAPVPIILQIAQRQQK